jgi:drug/metabolite transporter (DMT)-like permease
MVLAAIWGGSFLFMRMAVLDWRTHWRYYTAVGTINSAAPFALYAWSAQYLPASYLAVINATSPVFGTLIAAIFLGDRLTAHAAIGLAAGLAGVVLLVGLGPITASPTVIAATAAALGAAICYAIGSAYVKRWTYSVDASALAGGSNIGAALVLAPLAVASPPPGWPTPEAAWAAIGLGVLCTGVAYLFYYQLITDVGPARALTVTFLIPAFGILWGALFLGEPVTATMLAGCALVLVGTGLIFGRTPPRSESSQAMSPSALRSTSWP